MERTYTRSIAPSIELERAPERAYQNHQQQHAQANERLKGEMPRFVSGRILHLFDHEQGGNSGRKLRRKWIGPTVFDQYLSPHLAVVCCPRRTGGLVRLHIINF